MHLPNIIYDLALILIVASITTLIFKKLKQPVVLGYIVAGFIASSNFDLVFSVSDKSNISTWGEIGVIFLLFSLGLEFSLKKLTSVGHSAFITVITEVICMLTIGYSIGQALGWSQTDSVFLGGMLCMSSTIVIFKAFNDLKLKGEKFTHLVFGTLIVEDIVGIVMMVLLATVSVNSTDMSSVFVNIVKLCFFLVLWFVLGIFIIPNFFRKIEHYLNSETLLVVSLGMCLTMVVLSNNMGFSSALGAFITGSILSETRKAEHIEHLLTPVKDLFGAVFFVSVGMTVVPEQLVTYAVPIAVIVVALILGKLIFSSLGMLLSGQSLKTAMQCGFSLPQIGEFSFIIATLGLSLGVTSNFLYPIVVAVSVITTFTTPFFIKLAIPTYKKLEKIIPHKAKIFLQKYTSDNDNTSKKELHWRLFLKKYFTKLIVHCVLLSAICFFAFGYTTIITKTFPSTVGYILETVVPLLIMSPFLKDLLVGQSSYPELVATLWFDKKSNRLPLLVLFLLRILIAILFILIILFKFLPLNPLIIVFIACIIVRIIYSSDWLLSKYLKIEASFLINLNEKHLSEKKKLAITNDNKEQTTWLDEQLYVAVIKVETTIPRTLKQLSLRERFGVNVLKLIHKKRTFDMPGGNIIVKDNNTLVVLGTKSQINVFCQENVIENMNLKQIAPQITLKQFIVNQSKTKQETQLLLYAIIIDEKSPLLNKHIKDSNIREDWQCLVVGLERGVYSKANPHIWLTFEKEDIVWVIGKNQMIAELIRSEII